MSRLSKPARLIPALAAALLLAACSKESATHDMKDMKGMPGMADTASGAAMTGSHEMPGTVSAIDTTSGMMEVESEGMKLELHFPPAAVTDVKVGDKIEVQLGFKKL